jgi:hypothetical protein
MSGGTISGNDSNGGNGGGVYIISGTFAMSGGTIGGNEASLNGGGVYLLGGIFTKSAGGGIIYGQNAAVSLKNTAGSTGHAAYAGSGKKRDNTAGEEHNLNSAFSGLAGGWD